MGGVTASADVAALSGRATTFEKGVCIHPSRGYEEYREQYDTILEAKALGAGLIRTGCESDQFDKTIAKIADDNGMKVMFHLSLDVDVEGKSVAQIGAAGFGGIYERFYNKATALKDYDCYIQISNELDNQFYISGGTSASGFRNADTAAIAIYAANKAVQDANTDNGSNIKTVVNFSYNHYGFLDKLKAVKINGSNYTVAASASGAVYADWDINGLDYYSNMYDDTTYQTIISALKSKYPRKDIFVCETGLYPTGKTGNTINYDGNNTWLENFIRYCYNDSKIIGVCVYELYDEAHFESDNNFHRESHYGLIESDRETKKSTYTLIKSLYGGTGTLPSRTISSAPAAPAEYDVCISAAGVSTEWGRTYMNAGECIYLDFSSNPLNLNNFSRFEFDLYIEDYDSFALAAAGRRINFALSNHATDRTRQRIRFDIMDQIHNDGWNHISLKKSDRWQCDTGFGYGGVTYLMIFFQDGGNDYNPISGQKVAIANVYGTSEEIDHIPDWPEEEHVELLKSADANWWGSSAENNNHRVTDLEPVDMSTTDKVEFDVYIEDYAGFAAATASGAIRFRFGSGTNYGTDFITVNVKDKITQDGWNHVSAIWLSSSVDSNTNRHELIGSPDTTAITWVRLYSTVGITPEQCGQTRIANVCFTYKPINLLPDWPTYEHVKALRSNNANWWGGINVNNHLVTGLTPVNMSDTTYVEFDVYIDNYSGFVSQTASGNVRFRFGDASDYYITVDVKNKITQNGWNHVKAMWTNETGTDRCEISNSSINLNAITWVKLFTTTGIAWDACGKTRIANVCFTKTEIDCLPAWPEYERVEILKSSTANWWGGSANNSNNLVGKLGPVDMSETNYVEMDVYIQSYSGLMTATSGEDVCFRFGDAGDNYIDLSIKKYITQDGWNHIRAIWTNTTGTDRFYISSNSINLTAIKWIKLYSTAGIAWDVCGKTRMANVCFTKVPENRDIPAYPSDAIAGDSTSTWRDYWGQYTNLGTNFKQALASAINIEGTRTVEFDIYVADYAVYAAAAENHDLRFRFTSEGTSGIGSNYIAVNLDGKITKSGWNHVAAVWAKNDPDSDRYFLSGTVDTTAIDAVQLYWGSNTSDTISETLRNTYTRVANVCFAGVVLPTDIMTTKVDFIGHSIKSVQFDSEGYYSQELASSLDISGTRMIELDVYVIGSSVSSITVELDDSEDNYIQYTFTGLTTGWNHLAKRIGDVSDSDGEVDLTDIAAYYVTGAQDAKIFASNFYAANYVDGDTNRDGVADIRDIVHMKKYLAGIRREDGFIGNRIAMDVTNDGSILAADLTGIVNILIGKTS